MRKKLAPEVMAKIGRAGGLATLKKRGSKFFSKISNKRKNFRGGRPKGSAKTPTLKNTK